ncbi:MAG TPA: hypothetical protein VGK36_08950 [Candidatus Angelobacter sp.]|jgi:hypothetical protein
MIFNPMIRNLFQAIVAGVLFGFGLGSGLQEMWLLSIVFYAASCISLWLFIRAALRRIC